MTTLTAACIQMRSGTEVAPNVAAASELIHEAAGQGAKFIATPEMTNLLDIRPGMARLMQGLRARDGVFGILGNHDSADMAAIFDSLGVRMLINETATVMRGGEALHVTGVDDVHYYYTGDASDALRFAPDGCRIALVHSPELAEQAADAGVALYLTGHTHGGQVCLPGGMPVFTHSHGQRRFSSGLWRKGGMVGYTSRGAGVSGLPVRFNCPGEATLITLRRA